MNKCSVALSEMNILIILGMLILCVVALVSLCYEFAPYLKSQLPINDKRLPYYKKCVLSQPEKVLYFRLTDALPDHIVLSKVQMSQIIGVKRVDDYYSWFNKISRMSVDFLVCNKDFSIVAAIELDDSMPDIVSNQQVNFSKEKALISSCIKVLRWHTRSLPSTSDIRLDVLSPR
jgi:hypothetical protein